MTKNNRPVSSFLSEKNSWKENDNTVWLSTSLSLFRNINKFNFPGKLTTEKQKGVVGLITESLLKKSTSEKFFVCKAEDLGPYDKEYIGERFLSTEGYNQAHAGEAFILDEKGEFLATINVRDHLHLQLIDTRREPEKQWNRLVRMETALGSSLSYAFSSRYGFLTADRDLCGTAMQMRVFLQLPALIHTELIDDILNETADESIMITGLHGNPTEVVGDILVVKNNYTLGVTEENIISNIQSFAGKLILKEYATRKEIKSTQNSEIKDRVSRAYAILIHSYQIEAVEALNALSLVKLGVDFGWITGINAAALNNLFFTCRRAHLLCNFTEEIAQENLAHKRSEFIRESFKDVRLTI